MLEIVIKVVAIYNGNILPENERKNYAFTLVQKDCSDVHHSSIAMYHMHDDMAI